MNNRDKTLLQKIKDNAFYLALGLGLFAILAVVGVYTAQQNDAKLAEGDMDLNVASNYSDISEESDLEDVDAKVSKEDNARGLAVDVTEVSEEDKGNELDPQTEAVDEEVNSQDGVETESTTEVAVATPATADPGQLTFNSEETITWPVNGEVILPYSMETTVHFKTLDQYQCNPGMLIQAGAGTTVKNAYLGKVTEITSDNVYGNMVTLYVGNEYSIVYGQLDTIYVKEGDFIKAGDSIGTVGNPTDSFAEEGSHLFFQMKCGEEMVDPMLYIE